MQYIKLTQKAKDFIKAKCAASTTIFSATPKIKLPKSNIPVGTTFTATMVDDSNVPITATTAYSENLIRWFDEFGSQFLVDPNVAAAQAFQESGFSPLSFSQRNTMGISGINDYEYFNIIFSATKMLDDTDVAKMMVGVTGDPYQILTWIPNLNSRNGQTKSSDADNATATANRKVMFQNLANNPKIALFCQFYQLSSYGSTNKNLASSSLFSYYVRSNQGFDNYSLLLDFMKKKYGNDVNSPKDYVNNIFKTLASFGYDINFNIPMIAYTSDPDNPKNKEHLSQLTEAQLKGCCPKIHAENVPLVLSAFNRDNNMDKFQLNTRIRLAHFFAIIGHESGDLNLFTENLNYTAQQLMRVSPFNKYFKTVADTVGYVGFPEKIANIGYSNRSDLGNGPDPDGYTYRGRGAIQTTGRGIYDKTGKLMGLDLVANPELLAQPDNAVISAFHFWKFRNVNQTADVDNIIGTTKLVNGGYNGLDDRVVRLKKCKVALGIG